MLKLCYKSQSDANQRGGVGGVGEVGRGGGIAWVEAGKRSEDVRTRASSDI